MSEIKSWYADKNVLITGATGFIGKVLVERILRECGQVKCVYLIARGKKDFESRCQELLNHTVFEHIRQFKPEQMGKIKIFQGDLKLENLGLNNNDLTEIENNIDIVLHSGADVRFDLTLHESFTTNTVGTYYFLELAKRITNLKVFVFVSTTYSQSHQKVTEERHYDAEMDAFALMDIFKRNDEQVMTALQSKIFKEFPNTYSFSKHLSENVVYRYRNELPICIVRPSIVGAAAQYPATGYIEGLTGFTGWSYTSLRGVLRTIYCDTEANTQTICVDIVANAIIATSWIHGTNKRGGIEYYNANMTKLSQMSVSETINNGKSCRFEYPLNYSLWCPNNTFTKCLPYYYIRILFYQILPAILLDLLLWISGHQPIMLTVQRKIFYGVNILTPYLKVMKFETENFRNIPIYLNQVDNVIFDTNADQITLERFSRINALGIRKFIAKEKDEDLPRARRNSLILYFLHIAVQFTAVICLVKFIYARFNYKIYQILHKYDGKI